MDRSSHPSPVRVGSGKILVCTHMLGCAANMCDMENGPDKQIPDILRGSYLCSTGWSKKRKRAKPWGSCRKTMPSSWCRTRTPSPWRTKRRISAQIRETQRVKVEKEHPITPAAKCDGQPGYIQLGAGGGERDRVHRGVLEQGHVRDGEPDHTSKLKHQVSVKPQDWRLVKKRGIVPDGLVQSKLMSFIGKFPHLEKGRGAKMDRDGSTLERGGAMVLRMFIMVFRMLTAG